MPGLEVMKLLNYDCYMGRGEDWDKYAVPFWPKQERTVLRTGGQMEDHPGKVGDRVGIKTSGFV